MKKKSIKKLDELFDPNYFMIDEDTDFFVRCHNFGLTCKYVKDAKAFHITEPNQSMNLENKYYLTTKNQLYAWLKLSGINNKTKELFEFPRIKLIFKNFLMAFFNINLLSITTSEGRKKIKRTFLGKAKMLFGKHPKITRRSRFILVYLLFKAFFWNITNLKGTLSKRYQVQRKKV